MPKWDSDPIVGSKWSSDPLVEGLKSQSALDRFIRGGALAGRTVAEGIVDVVAPVANPMAYLANRATEAVGGTPVLPENLSQQFSETLTGMGVPEPAGTGERVLNTAGRIGTGIAAGAGVNKALMARMGAPRPPVNAPAVRPVQATKTAPAGVLAREGVPLDRSQATGGRFSQMLRAAVSNHPFTADKQAQFSQAQQRAFNRAVLRSVGANADEATQPVMNSAKTRIGSMFNRVGTNGTQFDDALQTQIASIVDDAAATVPKSELAPLTKNIDDLLSAVDDSGRINGDVLIRVRSRLSNLSRRPGIGQSASALEDALLDSLERTHPGQREMLREAVDQYRNLRIIQNAIDKGASGDISPLRLSNALATRANQNMSVYGRGGDQGLVELAQAGRSVLPQALPDSGTIPRGMMVAPLRSIASAPLYQAGQASLLAQPKVPGSGVLRPELVAAMQAVGSTQYRLAQEKSGQR